MLRQLRSSTGRWLFGIASLLIIPSFVLLYGWNSGAQTERSPNTPLAKISSGSDLPAGNITNADMEAARNLVLQRLSMALSQKGKEGDIQLLESIATLPEVFLAALDSAAIKHNAEQLGLSVGTKQVAVELAQRVPDPAARVQQMMAIEQQLGIKFDEWMERQRAAQNFQISSFLIEDAVRVTVNEAWIHHLHKAERLSVESIQWDSLNFRDKVESATTASLEAFLAQNSERFRVPNQAAYRYIAVSKDELRSSTVVLDGETSAAYEANKDQYKAPRAVRASMILIPNPEASESTTAAQESDRLIADVLDRARKGEDFAALYAQYSKPYPLPVRETDNTTATQGGSLGLVAENVARTEFGDDWTSTVFAAQPNTVVGPIASSTGGKYIVKVEGFREESIRPLSEVQEGIRAQLSSAKAETEFERLGKLLDTQAASVTTLDQLASVTGTTVTESGKVNRTTQVLPKLGLLGEMQDAINDLEKGGELELLSDARRHIVIQLVEEYPSRIPELVAVRAQVQNVYNDVESLKLAQKAADKAYSDLKAGKDAATVANESSTTVTRPEAFTRDKAAEVLGYTLNQFDEKSDGIRKGDLIKNEYRNNPTGQPSGVAILRVVSLEEPNRGEFLEKLPEITRELRGRKRQAYLNDYLAIVRKASSDRVQLISASLTAQE